MFLYSFIQQIYLNSFYLPDTEKTTSEKDEKDKLQTLKLKKKKITVLEVIQMN